MPGDESRSRGRGLDARVTLLLGPAVAVALWVAPSLAGMTRDAQNVAGLACWMAVWWIRGTIPLPATSLLPLAALPLLGAGAIRDVAARYADPVIFLFMGGFFLAAATERWDLHRRLALAVIAAVGGSAPRVVLAFMAATALVSMWISNTATAAMMLPIGAAVVTMARGSGADPEQTGQFGSALMLGLAYAASIGGAATLIGTPPNAIFAGAASQLLGRPVGFAAWMGVGLPIAVFMLLACWVLLTRVMHRVAGPLVGIEAVIARERNGLRAHGPRMALSGAQDDRRRTHPGPLGRPPGAERRWDRDRRSAHAVRVSARSQRTAVCLGLGFSRSDPVGGPTALWRRARARRRDRSERPRTLDR
jgi:sodium-dependent dicarboxylate transporter 2/3/5